MFLVYVVVFTLFFSPSVKLRKECVGIFRRVLYLCKTQPVGTFYSLFVDACPTYYIYVLVGRAVGQGLVERCVAVASGEVALAAAQDDVASVGQCPFGSDSKVFRPIIIVCPVVRALNRFRSFGSQ